MGQGRRPDLAAWLKVLSHLRLGGRFPDDVSRHYLRDLVQRGLIRPAPYFSHLPTDGAGAKRFILTRAGREELERLESSAPPAVIVATLTSESGEKSPDSSAGATASSAPRYSQRYAGGHNLCFRMVIEEPFDRPAQWETEHPMGPVEAPRWMSRHATYEPGVHIEEAGGTIRDPAGAVGHVLMLKFAVRADGRTPVEVEHEAESRALGIRRTLEMRYGCKLSDPELRGHPKHSFPRDPFAKVVRKEGIAIHGPVGVDDTPEENTLEIEDAHLAQRYVEGVAAIGTGNRDVAAGLAKLAEATGRLEAQVAQLVRSSEVQTVAQGEMLRRIEEIRKREPGKAAGLREN
jgi:hypothetical protein